jgi:hypothetical protein
MLQKVLLSSNIFTQLQRNKQKRLLNLYGMTGRISVSCENISSVTFILGTEKGMKLAQIFDEMKNILFYNAGINI